MGWVQTKSPLVALFFAFCKPHLCVKDEYRAIYVLDVLHHPAKIEIIESRLDIGGRMNVQQGVFTNLLSSELLKISRECLDCGHPLLVKVKINSKFHVGIMRYLNRLNIRAATLFPDMKGAVDSSFSRLGSIIERL